MHASKPRALVVDDDAPTCVLIADILRRDGYKVVTTTDPAEALRIAAADRARFDVAVLDVVMPTMSGDELARQLRKHDDRLKVLFLTGFSGALFQARPMLWEGEAYLEKPCTDRGLLEALALLITGRLPQGDYGTNVIVGHGRDCDPETPVVD
jgi:CheY-like chemotaxis protein